MKLLELQPQFLRIVEPGRSEVVDAIADAQGVRFLCPKCFRENGGPVHTHGVICWSRSRGVADDVAPGPGRWAMHGTSLADLTLDAEADAKKKRRSVLLTGGCGWHGFVTNGEVTDA